MHGNEWPLLVFTLLAQLSVGLFITGEVFHRPARRKYGIKTADHVNNISLPVISPLLLISLSVSFLHLGSPLNAIYALNNLASSWLSREILLEILFICFFSFYAFLHWRRISTVPVRGTIGLVTSVTGLFLVFSMAKLYMLPTVPVWNTLWTPISFFITTFLSGSLALAVLLALKSHRYLSFARYAIKRIALGAVILTAFEIVMTVLFLLSPGNPNISIVILRLIFLFIGVGSALLILYRDQWRGFVYAVFLAVLIAGGLGRYLFYASYAGVGL